MTKDMTAGSPAKLILSFSIPLLIGNIFQQFYNMADAIIVGKLIDVDALAAVGTTGPMNFLITGFVIGLAGGFSVVIAQRFGSGDYKEMRKATAISVYLSIAMTIVMTIVSLFAARPLLELFQTPANIIDSAQKYITVIFAGIGSIVFYNLLSGILRALGDSKTPLYFLIVASILNVVLDIVFIKNFGMGVEGTAYATVIAQAASGFLCLLYMKKKFPILHFQPGDWKWDPFLAAEHMRIGLPMALQFSITAIGVMVLQGAINSFGSTTVAAYTAATKVEQIATQPMATFGVTMATYAGQNLGAGKIQRIRDGVKKCCWISVAFSVVGGILVMVCGHPLVSLFVNGDQAAVFEQAQQYLNISAVFYWALALLFIFRNVLQGVGSSFMAMLAGVAELVARVVVALILSASIGYAGLCLAGPAAWVAATIPLLITYPKVMRKLKEMRPTPKESFNETESKEELIHGE